ncbi:MAG: homocitrate synthase [Bacillota bacterium]|nr:homocitrate synthase [Bacillota bacterium]
MNYYVVDTTLRDGEQKAGVALGMKDKIEISKLLNEAGIYQIEAGIPAMGGDEKQSIEKMMELNLKSKISSWNRTNLSDIQHSIDCGVDIIHISVPTSDIQIAYKLNKDRNWVIYNMEKAISFAKEKGFPVTVGFEDASRADIEFIKHLALVAKREGAERIRYADTVGTVFPQKIYEDIKSISAKAFIDIEIHAHNDFGMAVANSVAALEGGANYINCTIGGIGERAGNCNFFNFVTAVQHRYDTGNVANNAKLMEIEKKILGIIRHGA